MGFVRIPSYAVTTGEDLIDAGGRRRSRRVVLLVGEVPGNVRCALALGAKQLDLAKNVYVAVERLAATGYDAVVIDRHAPGGGLALVKLIKASIDLLGADEGLTQRARAKHLLTPFFLVDDASLEYAVIISPPEHSYYEDGEQRPFANAVLRLDVSTLIKRPLLGWAN